MQTQFYFLSPVEVVKVTSQNLDEVAEWCGGTVNETKSRKNKSGPDKYVWVPTPEGNKLSWAFPGMFITKRLVKTLKNEWKITYSVFRRDYFQKNYFDTQEAAVKLTWEAERDERNRPKPKPLNVRVVTEVSEAMQKALDTAQAKVKELEAKLDEITVENDKGELKDLEEPEKMDAISLNELVMGDHPTQTD